MSSIERAMERKRRDHHESVVPTAAIASFTDRPSRDPAVRLNLRHLRKLGMLSPDADHRELQEQYRLIKRQLLTRAFGDSPVSSNPPNLIQVTSSLPGEGKTFNAFNLGMSIAMELDFTVLLVDTDLTRRSLTRLVDLQKSPGITEVLTGTVSDVGSVVYATDAPRLMMIPSGQSHPRSTELVASEGMRRLTRELANRYPDRVVIFDSTPLLMDSQASTLAEHMGQVVVIVEAGRTAGKAVRDGVALLDPALSSIGLLLNKSTRIHRSSYYGGL